MKRKFGVFLTVLGVALLLASAGLAFWNLREDTAAGEASQEAVRRLREEMPETVPAVYELEAEILYSPETAPEAETATETPDYLVNPKVEMPQVALDGGTYIGILDIPALGLSLPVGSELTDGGLKLAPCRYKGSAYLGDLIVAAHNYKQHFGSLSTLRPGDAVRFTDADGYEFSYEVVELLWLDATAVEEMEAGEWDLTLFTCNTSRSQRITVRCVLAAS